MAGTGTLTRQVERGAGGRGRGATAESIAPRPGAEQSGGVRWASGRGQRGAEGWDEWVLGKTAPPPGHSHRGRVLQGGRRPPDEGRCARPDGRRPCVPPPAPTDTGTAAPPGPPTTVAPVLLPTERRRGGPRGAAAAAHNPTRDIARAGAGQLSPPTRAEVAAHCPARRRRSPRQPSIVLCLEDQGPTEKEKLGHVHHPNEWVGETYAASRGVPQRCVGAHSASSLRRPCRGCVLHTRCRSVPRAGRRRATRGRAAAPAGRPALHTVPNTLQLRVTQAPEGRACRMAPYPNLSCFILIMTRPAGDGRGTRGPAHQQCRRRCTRTPARGPLACRGRAGRPLLARPALGMDAYSHLASHRMSGTRGRPLRCRCQCIPPRVGAAVKGGDVDAARCRPYASSRTSGATASIRLYQGISVGRSPALAFGIELLKYGNLPGNFHDAVHGKGEEGGRWAGGWGGPCRPGSRRSGRGPPGAGREDGATSLNRCVWVAIPPLWRHAPARCAFPPL